MSKDEPALPLSGLDDEGLLAALRGVLSHYESAPSQSVDLAKSSYGLRAVDAELAVLISDSAQAAGQSTLRSDAAPRLLVFDAQDLSIEIEIEPGSHADSWRLIGQLTPATPARIQLRRDRAGPLWFDADEFGRFVATPVAAGSLSLICDRDGMPPAVTEWIAIG